MKKHKNWALFCWALKRLKIDTGNNDNVYKKCLRNNILLSLMDLSGITRADAQQMIVDIDKELARRAGEA